MSGTSEPTTLHCPACGYNLTGLTRDVCPECGQAFVRTTLYRPPVPSSLGVITNTILMLVAPLLAFAMCALKDTLPQIDADWKIPVFLLILFVTSGYVGYRCARFRVKSSNEHIIFRAFWLTMMLLILQVIAIFVAILFGAVVAVAIGVSTGKMKLT